MIVLKFGGTSVSTKKSIETICKIVKREKVNQPIVVVSALKGVTDMLFALTQAKNVQQKRLLKIVRQQHFELISALFSREEQKRVLGYIDEYLQQIQYILLAKTFDKQKEDLLVSYGERMSSYIITSALRDYGIPAQQVIATELIVTDDQLEKTNFLLEETRDRLQNLYLFTSNKVIPIITGFIGATRNGRVATLGRGGSDYSAAIIGACLQAQEIQIWTDVDGVYTEDPNICKDAKKFDRLSYKRASMLAMNGAKVLHPQTIKPASQASIPVRVLNTFHPENSGTLIS